MKKALLIIGAMVLASTCTFAQKLVPAKTMPNKANTEVLAKKAEALNATMAPVKMADMREVKATTSRHMAPRRTMADEVWYQRPEGSFYVSGSSGTSYWSYLYMPAFADVTYKNMATRRTSVKWSHVYNDEADSVDGNEDNDLEETLPKIQSGYISSYYIPTMTSGRLTYTFGENFPNTPDVALINGDTIMTITDVNLSNGYYYGFSNGSSFGNRTAQREIDGETVDLVSDAIYEFYKKPVKPLYLTDLWFRVVNYEGTPLMNEGTEMKVIIRKVDEEGNIGDLIAEMPFTLNDTVYCEPYQSGGNNLMMGAFLVSKKETDAFGTEYDVPVIIEDEFVIIISGFQQEGVNFSLYMTGDLKEIETDSFLNDGMVIPTCRSYVRADNGEPVDGLYYCQAITKEQSDKFNIEDGDNYDWTRHYNAVIHLDAMTDVVRVYDDFTTMYADSEGGEIFAVVEELNQETGQVEYVGYGSVQYQSTLPRLSEWEGLEGEENYQFEDLPDWLSVTNYIDTYYDVDYGYTTLAILTAEPLPEGVTGRKAEIRIVSERGADSGIITVIQGDTGENEEEETVPFDFTAKVGVAAADWVGSSGLCATQFAPAITTADGRTAQLAEKYETTVEPVGDIMTQTIEGLENGNYTVTLVANAFYTYDRGFESTLEEGATDVAYVYANDQKAYITAHIATATSENGEFTLNVNVTDGTLKLGYAKDKPGTNWHTIQIKALTQQVPLSQAWEALAAEAQSLLDQDMEATVLDALKAALDAVKSVDNYNALAAAVAAAKASANAYANAANVLTAMKALVDATNVYTQEAYDEYYGTPAAKYEAKTLTAAEGAALQNPEIVTGWHAAITVDNFLLSAWDTNPDFVDAPYYINTWSVEGDSDGSNFRVPFFEYWTGDGDSLGERTLTATMTGLENGEYEVTSWTRVRTKNNTGAYTSGEGIFLQVNDGNAVDAAKGDSKYELGADNNFFVGNVAAKGNVTDGTLNIKYIVAADNNVSWLSFKNVFYKRIGDVNGINTVNAAAEQNNQMFNLQGQKVEKADKGLYIINGKKVVVK